MISASSQKITFTHKLLSSRGGSQGCRRRLISGFRLTNRNSQSLQSTKHRRLINDRIVNNLALVQLSFQRSALNIETFHLLQLKRLAVIIEGLHINLRISLDNSQRALSVVPYSNHHHPSLNIQVNNWRHSQTKTVVRLRKRTNLVRILDRILQRPVCNFR